MQNALIRIEITDEPLQTYAAKADPQTGMLRPARSRQKAYVHQGAAYPLPFMIDVQAETGPYRPGFYLIGGDIFKAGEYDGLKFWGRSMRLVPVEDVISALGAGAKPKIAAAS
jgi:hypothetical protein